MSLRGRMGLVAGLAVALAVLAVAVVVYGGTRATLRGQVDKALSDRAKPFTRLPPARDGDEAGGRNPAQPASGGQDAAREPGPFGDPGGGLGAAAAASTAPFGGPSGTVQFVSRAGGVYRPTDEQRWPVPIDAGTRAIASGGHGRHRFDVHTRGVHLRVLTVGVGSRGAIEVARPLTEVDGALHRQLLLLIVVGVAGIALAGLIGLAVARTALAPITRFTRRTESLATDIDVSRRLEVKGDDELARLARSFNQTLDALGRSVDAQRNLVADASHELRTPIATLRANFQLMAQDDRLSPEDRESVRRDILHELDELTALVGDVVELARGSKAEEALDEVRLDEIVHAQVGTAGRRAPEIDFVERLEPTVVRGEPERINRAVSNLLDNARKWSPVGSRVEVDLEGGVLTVRDRGPGFDAADLPHVFDRFYRAADARGLSGSGLGLAIVRQAAEAHGGFVKADNAPGGGAVVRASFGRAAAPDRPTPTLVLHDAYDEPMPDGDPRPGDSS